MNELARGSLTSLEAPAADSEVYWAGLGDYHSVSAVSGRKNAFELLYNSV
jgi:hypothetical protein